MGVSGPSIQHRALKLMGFRVSRHELRGGAIASCSPAMMFASVATLHTLQIRDDVMRLRPRVMLHG
eukprot:2216416-Amphidinium_carterae.1